MNPIDAFLKQAPIEYTPKKEFEAYVIETNKKIEELNVLIKTCMENCGKTITTEETVTENNKRKK